MANDQPIVPNDNVNVGTAAGKPISVALQHVQQIFHEITGKSDTLSKRYELNFRICVDDIVQLNERIKQVLEQYDVKANNCSVTLYFVDNNRQQFKSFESFRVMNAASTSCVESAVIQYDILIIPPVTKIMQTFELTVRLTSRMAAQKQFRESTNLPLPRVMQALITGTTAVISVKHVDYNIAHTLLEVCNGWLNSCPHTEISSFLKFLKRYSHLAPPITQYGVGSIAAVAIVHELPNYLTSTSTPPELAAFLIVSMFAVFGLYRLGFHLGRTVEDGLDSYQPISYLKLTRGDDVEIQKTKSSATFNSIKGGLAFGAAVLEAALASLVVSTVLALFAKF